MTVPRIYLPQKMEKGELIELTGDNFRYIKNVLRLRVHEPLALFGYQGHEYSGKVEEFAPDSILIRIKSVQKISVPDVRITLAQALPKGDKMEFIIQKATELGVGTIIPFHSLRTIPRIEGEKARNRVNRWRKIALEASRQSGRGDIPQVDEIGSFHEIIQKAGPNYLKMIFWEAESGLGIKEVLRSGQYADKQDFFLIVGPEGGLSGEEVTEAVAMGFISVSLGVRVLKVETASLAILSIIQYEKGLLGMPGERGGVDEL